VEKYINQTLMTEPLIIEEIKNGNNSQLAEIYKAYRGEFVGWASRHFQCDKEEARDIYQASIITLYDNIINEKLKPTQRQRENLLVCYWQKQDHGIAQSG